MQYKEVFDMDFAQQQGGGGGGEGGHSHATSGGCNEVGSSTSNSSHVVTATLAAGEGHYNCRRMRQQRRI